MPVRRYIWIAVSLVLPIAFTVITLTRPRPHDGVVVERPTVGPHAAPAAPEDASPARAPDAGTHP